MKAMKNNLNEILVNDMVGWTCPKCGKVLSPLVTMCPCGMKNPEAKTHEYEDIEKTYVEGKALNS